MPKKLTSLLFLVFLFASMQAQVIRGRLVCPEDSTAAAFASIELVDTANSLVLAKTITDKRGKYVLSLKKGMAKAVRLVVEPSLMGFETIRRMVAPNNLPTTITIYPKETQLGEAVVRASYLKPTPSGYTYDMNRFKKNFGNQEAFDVLTLLPGVTCDDDRIKSLKVNGRDITEIYVNGQKASVMDLEALTADMLKTVEIDFWEGGEISEKIRTATMHIRLDKINKGGYYGTIVLGSDHPIQHGDKGKNGAYYFFWWKSPNGRWNIKNHLRYQYEGAIESSTETQENRTAGTKEENRIRKKLNNHWLLDELSTVYEFTPKTNIGINYSLNFSDRKPFTRITNNPGNSYDRFTNHERTPQHNFTLAFNTLWGDRGSRLYVALDYLTAKSDVSQYAFSGLEEHVDTGYTAFGSKFAIDQVMETTRLHLPLSNKVSLRFSDATQWVQRLSRPVWEERGEAPALGTQISRNKTQLLTHYSAAYLMGSYKRWYYSGGFNVRTFAHRYETVLDTLKYTEWAFNPRASLKYLLDDTRENTIELSYYRELGNVPYNEMALQKYWSDANHYVIGNPNLKAKVEQGLEINLMHLQGRLNVYGKVTKIDNNLFYQVFPDPELPGIYYSQPRNISGEWTVDLSCSYTYQPLPWLIIRPSVYGMFRREKQEVSGIFYKGWSSKGTFALSTNANLQNGWRLNLNLNYTPTYRVYNRTWEHNERAKLDVSKEIKGLTLGGYIDYSTPQRLRTRTGSDYVLYSKSRTPEFTAGVYLFYRFRGKRDVNVKEVNRLQ